MAINIDTIFADFEPWILVLILAVAMLSTWGAGWWLGSTLRVRHGEQAGSKFDDASLALVGLLLAFAFGMALAKHDHRRDMVVADSNSIGDFYSCASTLKQPLRAKLQTVIREYLEVRVELVRRRVDRAASEEAVRRSQQMQAQMTELVAQAVNEGTPIAVPLMNTLNALTSNHAARLAAAKDRLPASILLLLFVAAATSAMLVGREQGVMGRVEISGTLIFILLVTLTVYVTLDLNQPQSGMIVVDQTPMQQLLSSLNK
jgi:hypothetical protein